MNYHLKALTSKEEKKTYFEEKLFEMIEDFEAMMGPGNLSWTEGMNPSTKFDLDKIKTLLKYVRITTTQSIIYLFRNTSAATIDKKLRYMRDCEETNKTINEINFSDEDKFCFAKLALAKILRVMFKHDDIDADQFGYLETVLMKHSKHLCEVEYAHSPEPYLFYIMLTWPFQGETVSKHFDEDLFKKCLIKLSQLEEKIFTFWNPEGHSHFRKPQVQFFLQKEGRYQVGIRRVTLKRARQELPNSYRATGHLTSSNKGVTHLLPSGEKFEIRKAFLGSEGLSVDDEDVWQDQGRHEVGYSIGFTFGGPVAYNVEVLQPSIAEKMRNLQQQEDN